MGSIRLPARGAPSVSILVQRQSVHFAAAMMHRGESSASPKTGVWKEDVSM